MDRVRRSPAPGNPASRRARLATAFLIASVAGPLPALAIAASRGHRSSGGAGVTTTGSHPGVRATVTNSGTTTTVSTNPPGVGQSSGGTSGGSPHPKRTGPGQRSPLAGRALWIWELPSSDGGNVSTIIQRAHAAGIGTLLIKSGDGGNMWSQFTPQLLRRLHAANIRVCGWQYVYGNRPGDEAAVAAQAASDGADCLVIDAEVEYQGKYVQAQTYLRALRKVVGAKYPLVLAGFPYVDYHPSFPYSVFLGPGGAQYNAPQMYWKDIGVSVDTVFAHTFVFNRPYLRPIFPLGQLYQDPSPQAIKRFRALSRSYGAPGVSWWDWQETTSRGWAALSQPVGDPTGFSPDTSLAPLRSGDSGDLVVWAQEHLRSAGYSVALNGLYNSTMVAWVEQFQYDKGLPMDGVIGTLTWNALLRYPAPVVNWTQKGSRVTATTASARRQGHGIAVSSRVPVSASLPMRRNELSGSSGAGGRSGAGG